MKTYFVDSDVLIDFFKKRQEAVELVEKLSQAGKTAISIISVAELRSGWSKEDAATYLPRLYNIFEVIPLTKEIAEKAGAYRNEYSKQGRVLPTIDTLIAATTLVHGYCLVTRNRKDYPIPELDLYKDVYQ